MRQSDDQRVEITEAHQARLDREETEHQLILTREKTDRQWARLRLVGSWALGVVSLYKLLTVDTDAYLWVGTALSAFGLAQWEQLVKAIRK